MLPITHNLCENVIIKHQTSYSWCQVHCYYYYIIILNFFSFSICLVCSFYCEIISSILIFTVINLLTVT